MEHRQQRWLSGSFVLAAVGLSVVAGGVSAGVTRSIPGYELIFLAGLVGLVPVLALGLARFDRLVFTAFLSLWIVRWEPAPVDLLVALLFALGLVGGQLSLRELRGSSTFHAGLWVFAALNATALLVAADLSYSLRYVAISVYLFALAYFVKLYITSIARMRVVLYGYLAGALIAVGLVGLELVGVSPTTELFVFENRARALFKDANVFAPYLILPIVLLLDELIRPALIPGRTWLKIAAIIALSAGVGLAFSRAAWANLVVALVVYLGLMAPSLKPGQWIRLLLSGLVGVMVLALLIVQLGLIAFLRWRARPVQTYDVDRFSTQAQGIEAGLSNLFGIGPGMLYNAHSLYVRTFAEYGVFGLLALGVVVLVPLAACLRRALRADDRVFGLSARVVVACWGGLLLNSIVIDTLHWRSFWVLLALGWIIAAASSGRKDTR